MSGMVAIVIAELPIPKRLFAASERAVEPALTGTLRKFSIRLLPGA
jgi:hypothetical protein